MSWKENTDRETKAESLKKEFKFKDFVAAWGFMTKVALLAEKMDHHPYWSNSYNKVNISLSTHSAGSKITDKDRKMADQIDQLFE
jgi:4a-hydroxytetrahydrobiopterin dehydratase